MRFAYTLIYVEDVSKTIEFYEKAFGFKKKFITPQGDYGELDTGQTTLCFASNELGESNFPKGFEKISKSKKPVGIEIAFTTQTIEKDFKRAVNGGAVVFENITQKPWGQKVGYLQDNNGLLIELCTPIK